MEVGGALYLALSHPVKVDQYYSALVATEQQHQVGSIFLSYMN